ncbi:MAG: [Fe-Fe] hydrogenase large subunit C-terminal domain-containing protein [bacterium]|jgi:Na+-translocating ferredoxin:NAD+ oxidoreductase RNF subunit RnfB|nr:4Fe-4S dicluster domain-containing protein [Bacillota bacterium]
MDYFHSVRLDREKCKGCVNCIKRCPVEAIRVRHGKAEIMEDRCIDCGECIRACPNHAKYVERDTIHGLPQFAYTIALPAPSLYGQFRDNVGPGRILAAIKSLGFDDVWEVALGAEIVSRAVGEYFQTNRHLRPLISSACPAVVRLVQVRFPSLVDHIIPLESPMHVTASLARWLTAEKTGIHPDKIGLFFFSPCPAKVTAVKNPVGGVLSEVDRVLAVTDVYGELLQNLRQGHPCMVRADRVGIGWGSSGGEQAASGIENSLIVDGIHNVISVLEEIELGRLGDIDFIEAQACPGGCVGGILNVNNRFVAGVRLQHLVRDLPQSAPLSDRLHQLGADQVEVPSIAVEPRPIVHLDRDLKKAMQKLQLVNELMELLPGLDCGSCGAPTCRALAEDIAVGKATETDCIFKLRERIMSLALDTYNLAQVVPPAMDTRKANKGGKKDAADTTGTDSGTET